MVSWENFRGLHSPPPGPIFRLSRPPHPAHPRPRFVETTPAILIRKIRFGDTSLIVTWFTAAHGKLKTLAKGALRPKSRLAGTLDLFFDCEISFSRSAKSDLHSLRECALTDPRDGLRREYPRLALASYFVELMDDLTELEHPAADLFDLLRRALSHLGEKPASRRALLHFESELARLLGIQNPDTSPIMALARACHRIPAAREGLLQSLPSIASQRERSI